MGVPEPSVEVLGGRYAVEYKLGQGGVGGVYLALDTQLNRWVAVKRLHTDTLESARRAELAMQEAQSLAALQHPNVVTVHDVLALQDEVCVVMEFVQGRTLESIAASAPLTFEDFVRVARQTLDGLGAAHRLGMIHRDIKPANVMVAGVSEGDFQVKILDFGLAKILSEPSLQTVDHSGSLLGSIHTMAPEQLEHRALDQRTDLYSVGCTLYYALTGRNPFEGDTVAAVITSHLQNRFTPLAPLRPDLPPALCAWVERLFSNAMDARPASANAAAAELAAPAAPVTSAVPAPAPPRGSKPVFVAERPAPKPVRSGIPVPVLLGAGIAVLVAGIGGVAFLGGGGGGENRTEAVPTEPAAPAAPAPPATAVADEVSPGDRARLLSLLGKPVVVRGTIGRYGENKSGTIRFLNFANSVRGDLALVFFVRSDEQEFTPARLRFLIGRQVTVRGTVSEYNGAPQIEISSMSQIAEE
jgi:tRNA A-37 threonylcarbamoyl transferase component Bud32